MANNNPANNPAAAAQEVILELIKAQVITSGSATRGAARGSDLAEVIIAAHKDLKAYYELLPSDH